MPVIDQQIQQQSGRDRYIIRASAPLAMRDFIASLDAGIDIVDRIGPASEPHTVIIAATAEQQRALAQRIANNQQLTIEPDQPLSMFGADTGLPREE